MNTDFVLQAESRTELGTSAVRRLRRADKVPGVLYGAGHNPMALTFNHREIIHQLENEAFYSHVLTVKMKGKEYQVVLKALQRHPAKPRILHLDLLRISAKEKINMHVPLHFMGEEKAPGVKTDGGVVSHLMSSVEVRCLAKDLPEYIEVDLSQLELNQSIHLSQLEVPDSVELTELTHGEGRDAAVVRIHAAKGAGVEEEGEEPAGAEGEGKESESE